MRFALLAAVPLACAVLAGQDSALIRLPAPAGSEYTVEAEIQFGRAGAPLRVEAGGELQAAADEQDSLVALKVLYAGKECAAEIERLKPLARKGWGAGVEEELAREAQAMQGWRGRWFALRVEVARDEVWFWFDGRAIGRTPRSASLSGILLHPPDGGAIREHRIRKAGWSRGGYQTLDLRGYLNTTAGGRPAGTLRVGGIPFETGGGVIDVGRAGLRLRKKPSGPGSLYQNPYNFISAMDGDPVTILLRVPKRYYRRAWLLGAADDANGASRKMTVRLARYRGDAGVFFADSEVAVPRAADQPRPGMPPSVSNGAGRLWLVEVPLDPGSMQDIMAANDLVAQGNPSQVLKQDAEVPWIEIDLTRELRADLNCMLPLGPPSGVHIYGMTLEESPVRMVVTSPALGNLFEPGQAALFDVHLENVTTAPQIATLVARTVHTYGAATSQTLPITLATGEKKTQRVTMAAARLGKYEARFELTDARGRRMVARKTTFAIVPPDTRQAERDSPFGLWSWGGGHLTPPNEWEAALMRRAGARFTLGVKYPSKHQYGIGTGTDSVIGVFYSKDAIRGDPAAEAVKMVEDMKARGSNPRYWQIYWEDAISDRHHRRYPPSLIGRPPMELDEAEKARLKSYWDRAEAYADRVRREMPREKLALGAFANFTEEFLRRGFPKQYLDAISLEATAFRTQPERPPDTDDVQALYFIQEWKKKYGYQDLDTIMVESLFRGTAPGYLSERGQANYYVRDFLHGLAYGVKLFGMSAMITDVSNDYYRSTWGNVGLCHGAPEPSPKESYVAYATMTDVLDQARYLGYLETGSKSVYALHFAARDGEHIYALWTTRGKRAVTLQLAGGTTGVVIDAMHNQTPLQGGRITVSESPVYLKAGGRVTRVQPGAPQYHEAPPPRSAPVDALAGLTGWRPANERDPLLEGGNPRYPRRPGAVNFAAVRDAVRGDCIEVSGQASPGSPLLPMYGGLERRQPAPIPGRPRRLGLWVNGNSGWGRVIFELIDSKGERWMGVGGSEDSYGHTFVNFDGWRWVEIDLPGHFRQDYPWPTYGNWTSLGGDGLVDYPLALSKIMVELRDQIVYVNQLVPVAHNRIRLSGLRAID